MKDFLEEYGFAILAVIVVIILIALATPVGNLIKNHVSYIIKSFAYRTETKMFNIFIEPNDSNNEELIMPNKGDLITLNNDENVVYRVLKVNGNDALVLTMTNLNTNSKFNASDTKTTFDNNSQYQKYADGALDMAMTTYYNDELSDHIKSAIVPQTIKQNAISSRGGIPSGDYLLYGTYSTNTTYFSKVSEVTVGERYVYALDIEDIAEYLGKDNLSMENLNKMFFNTENSILTYSWLRSSYNNGTLAFIVYGYYGILTCNIFSNNNALRPAFVINLSHVDFEIVENPSLGW